tara:strand:- start:337 stop:1176 length:840 start_codon:yes stop_codon:yes gene_type:complete
MVNNKIILYYQTLIGLDKIYNNKNNYVTHIHLSSFHFGLDSNNNTYIHLNNYSPYDKIFDKTWGDLIKCKKQGIKIIIMIGGAGGAYNYMFQDENTYNECMKLLLKFINDKKDIIDGIDLDIEEYIGLDNCIKLINDLNNNLPKDFIFSMAPVSDEVSTDTIGLGGFKYSDLIKSNIGNRINYFNCQFYDYNNSIETSLADYYNSCTKIIPRDKLVLGVEYVISDFYNELTSICFDKSISGVYFWEYINIPNDFIDKVESIFYDTNYDLDLKYANCNIL